MHITRLILRNPKLVIQKSPFALEIEFPLHDSSRIQCTVENAIIDSAACTLISLITVQDDKFSKKNKRTG